MSKLVFITGASSGIGQALALRFFQAGYRLALVARRTSVIESWASAEGISADSYKIYSTDVAVPDSIVAAGLACIASQGVPDVVIASAGISIGMDTAMHEDLAVMAQTFATNNLGLAATFHPFIQAMAQRAVARWSASAVWRVSGDCRDTVPIAPAKAGVIAYCESLRGELRASGVKVVTICPGYIDTPLTQKNSYGMPFLMQPQDFANKALATIESGCSYRVIPWQMGVVAKLMRLLPNAVYDKLLVGRARKPRQTAGSGIH